MRRFLFVIGVLATVAASQSEAGYLIVRVIVEGGAGAGDSEGMPGGALGMSPRGEGETFAPRPSGPPRGSMRPPGSTMPGGSMMPGGPAGPGGGGGAHDPTRSIFVVVPFTKAPDEKGRPFYTKKAANQYSNPIWKLPLTHPFGHTNLFFDDTQIQLYTDHVRDPAISRTHQSAVVAKHAQWLKNPADGQPLLDILNDALEHGMVTEAVKYADELLTAVQDKKVRTTPPVERFASAYAKVQKPLKQRPNQRGDGASWRERLSLVHPGANEQTSAHYYLVYWDSPEAERARRLSQLEDNFRAFYLWHATQGVALPVPARPLVAVLPKTGADVNHLAHAIDGMPRVTDAFYAPDHDVLVLSPERLDGLGQTFQRQIQQIYREGVNRQDLLKGETGPRIDTSGTVKDARKPEDVARMMTWAMVERYYEEGAEWSAVSREGTRQLLYASGVLPQHVTLPLWLSNGSIAFFHRPKDPVYTTKDEDDKTVATLALTTGFGTPNYVRQKQFKELVRHKQLNTDPGLLLRHVVTDAYYAAIQSGIDADDPKLPLTAKKKSKGGTTTGVPPGPGGPGIPMGPPGFPMGPGPGGLMPGGVPTHQSGDDPTLLARKKREFLVNKAYATSWALYYYLAKNDPDGLKRYLAEINKLPRDLPLDETTWLKIFAKSFNLTTDRSPKNGQKTFTEFAKAWLDALDKTPLVGVDVTLHEPSPSAPSGGTNPGLPGGPGSPLFPPQGEQP